MGSIASPSSRIRWARDALGRSAVLELNDHVLGDVAESSSQVARVSRSKRGVGQTLAGAVGRHEVFEHSRPLWKELLTGSS